MRTGSGATAGGGGGIRAEIILALCEVLLETRASRPPGLIPAGTLHTDGERVRYAGDGRLP